MGHDGGSSFITTSRLDLAQGAIWHGFRGWNAVNHARSAHDAARVPHAAVDLSPSLRDGSFACRYKSIKRIASCSDQPFLTAVSTVSYHPHPFATTASQSDFVSVPLWDYRLSSVLLQFASLLASCRLYSDEWEGR